MKFRLLPSDDAFFEILDNMGKVVEQAAHGLNAVFEASDDRGELTGQLRNIEHKGDELLRLVLEKLNTSFVTPLDREDILALANLLDDAIDDLYHVGEMIHLMNVNTNLAELGSQMQILIKCAAEVSAMTSKLNNPKTLNAHITAVQQLESEADNHYRSAVAALFSGSYEPLEVMKLRDVVGSTERCIDGFEDIADLVDSIRVKQS